MNGFDSKNVISAIGRQYLRLHLASDVGPIRVNNLLEYFGSISAIFDASRQQLTDVDRIGSRVAESIWNARDDELIEREVARAAEVLTSEVMTQRAVLSIWWAAYAIPVLAIGFIKRIPSARVSALALIGIAATKALAYDLFQVEAMWRVAIFLALGTLMMAIAIVYGRINARSKSEPCA